MMNRPTSRSLTASDAMNQFCTPLSRRSAAMATMTSVLPSTIVMMMAATATVARATRILSSPRSVLVVVLTGRNHVIVASSTATTQDAEDISWSSAQLIFIRLQLYDVAPVESSSPGRVVAYDTKLFCVVRFVLFDSGRILCS